MFTRHLFLWILAVATSRAMAGTPDTSASRAADSTALVQAMHEVEPWVARQLHALRAARTPAKVKQLADELAFRTDSLTSRFRQVFPDNDDGWTMFSIYNGLASATACENPGLAAVYRGAASLALYSGDSPYRPDSYHALARISDHAWSLARAKDPRRAEHLLEKLDADHMDLIVAL